MLTRDTGFTGRPYGENPYTGYDRIGSQPIFGVDEFGDFRLDAKERVLTVEVDGDAVAFPFSVLSEQVVIEAIAHLLSGPAFSEVALLCRWRDLENFTALAVRADGSAAIWQLRNGETYLLQDWAEGFSGLPDVPIDLRATCHGKELRLEAAGVTVAEAIDPFPISGDIALMAGLSGQGRLLVLFDDVRVSRAQGIE